MARFESRFQPRDRVAIDGAEGTAGVITGFMWDECGGAQVRVAWIDDGASRAEWLQDWRLTLVAGATSGVGFMPAQDRKPSDAEEIASLKSRVSTLERQQSANDAGEVPAQPDKAARTGPHALHG